MSPLALLQPAAHHHRHHHHRLYLQLYYVAAKYDMTSFDRELPAKQD